MSPLYNFLRLQDNTLISPNITSSLDTTLTTNLSFPKGTICSDKRLDLCKQVIGPVGVVPLMASLHFDAQR
jgi:hypothetical protein